MYPCRLSSPDSECEWWHMGGSDMQMKVKKVFACMNISRRVVLGQRLEAIIDHLMHLTKFQGWWWHKEVHSCTNCLHAVTVVLFLIKSHVGEDWKWWRCCHYEDFPLLFEFNRDRLVNDTICSLQENDIKSLFFHIRYHRTWK